MATTLLAAVAVTTTSGSVKGVPGIFADRTVLIVSDNAGASVQVEVSANDSTWVPYESPVANGTGIVRVPAALSVRVVLTRSAGTASAWVA